MFNNYKPLVSVHMITYNHEQFIEQAIQGVLMQETSFKFELVIGEDCSTDRTREICENYALRYPEIIRLLPSEKNLGMEKNSLRTIEECFRSKYIAFCEGDDYWTSDNKLATQIAYLENNNSTVMCFHSVRVINDIENVTFHFPTPPRAHLSFYDILSNHFIPTCSLVIRTSLMKSFLVAFSSEYVQITDRLFELYISSKGMSFYYVFEMAAYRKQHGGVTNSIDYQRNKISNTIAILKNLCPHVSFYKQLALHLKIMKYRLGIIKNQFFSIFNTT